MRFILKRVIYLLLLVGVLSIPVLMLNSQWRDSLSRAGSRLITQVGQLPGQFFSSSRAAESDSDDQRPLSPLAKQVDQAVKKFHGDGGRISDFNKIFQCGAPRSWVQRTYGDASRTVDADQQSGLRVTLVTGNELEDLAGSLTYWFDRQGKVQRIQFRGVTGNPAKLASFARRSQKMVPRARQQDALFVRTSTKGTQHLLRISRPAVVDVSTLYGRYNISLELNRSGSFLSNSSQKMLEGA